ncbi:MAG: histidinol-phosphate aminotransferase family protein [Candidatus Pacebacteria bacterium]|nr:histidinol-phosphate aminotransferase family protein [Candidatus Paceibacterota bacterium]
MKEKLNMERLGNPWGPSPVLERQRERIISEADGIGSEKARQLLKIKIADWIGVPLEQIGVSRGSSEIIELICQEMLANQAVVMPVPTYFGLTDSLKEAGSELIEVPAGTGSQFVLNEQLAEELIITCQENNAHLWLCSPNNPTGSVMESALIEEIVTSLSNQLVIVDEAYLEYIDPKNNSSAAHLVGQHPNLIVTKTLSKAYALPDLRMGIMIADPQVAAYTQSRVSQSSPEDYIKARYAIDDQEHILKFAQWIKTEVARLIAGIKILVDIEASVLSATGVMILKHKVESLYQLLKEMGIKSRDMNNEPGIEGERYVRVGLQKPELNGQFLHALASLG